MDLTAFPTVLVPNDSEPLRGPTFGGRLTGWFADPIFQCVVFIAVVSVIFVALPGIDVWFSGLFAAPDKGGFPVSRLPAFQFLRDTNRALTWIVPIALIALVIVKLVRPDRPSIVPPARTLFILSTLAVGPGIVVNLIFKNLWGRPRPNAVDIFGGTQPFVEAWRITRECTANCSFVSGEGSSSIWLLSLVVLVPLVWRAKAMKWLFAYAALISLNRIAYGGHFLSDVLLAWGFTLLIMMVAYRLVIERPLPWFDDAGLEDGLTRAGVWLRRRLGFPTPGLAEPAHVETATEVPPPPTIETTYRPLPPDVPTPSTERTEAPEH